MTWNGFNITRTGILDDAQTAFDGVKSGLETILTTAKAEAELAKLLAGAANPALLALEAALNEIIDVLEALETTGFPYILATPYEEGIEAVYHRPTRTMTLTPESALKQVDKAFDDKGDARRPWGPANWGGLVVVGSAPGLEQFYAILAAIGKFFSFDKLIKLAEKLDKHWAWYIDGFPDKKPVLSSGLDFGGINQADLFPAFNDVIVDLKNKADGIRLAIVSGAASLGELIEFIDRQIEELAALAGRIENFIDNFNFSLGGTGVYYQYFDRASHTVETIRAGLTSGHPAEWKDHSYSAVLGLFSNSESLGRLATLLGL